AYFQATGNDAESRILVRGESGLNIVRARGNVADLQQGERARTIRRSDQLDGSRSERMRIQIHLGDKPERRGGRHFGRRPGRRGGEKAKGQVSRAHGPFLQQRLLREKSSPPVIPISATYFVALSERLLLLQGHRNTEGGGWSLSYFHVIDEHNPLRRVGVF